MSSDAPRLRYLFPRFKGNYNGFMKTLKSSCAFDASDVAKYRLKVVEFGATYGWKAVKDAFGVKRSTYFLWKQRFAEKRSMLSSLVPLSTRPHRLRQRQVEPRIVEFIRAIREQYGRVGKEKLRVLLAEYCHQESLVSPSSATIGRIIKQHRFFFEGNRCYRKKRSGVLRVRKAPKENTPGYIEMDSVIVRVMYTTHVFITAIDVVTKYAQAFHATTPTSARAKALLELMHTQYQFPVRVIQTDNGSEFLGEFESYCQQHSIMHVFTYPRSPKINGGVERFNRTIQEEFIERSDHLLEGQVIISNHLQKYLNWYNGVRPHQALGYRSPNQFMQTLQSNMY